MEYRQLVAFRTVARTLSFTQAANELRFAQSTITAQVKGLENELRVPLFDRRGGRVALTAFGERLLPYAERLLSLAAEARRAVGHDGTGKATLVVGAGEAITTYRLPGLIEAFHHRRPEVYLALRGHVQDVDQVLRLVDLKDADVLLLHGNPVLDEGLSGRVIGTEAMSLVVARDHTLGQLSSISPVDLAGTRSIITGPRCVYARLLDTELPRHGVPRVSRLEFGTIEAVKQAVAAGLGMSLLPRMAVRSALVAGELVELPWRPTTALHTHAVWPTSQTGSAIVEAFVALVTNVIQDAAPASTAVADGGAPLSR